MALFKARDERLIIFLFRKGKDMLNAEYLPGKILE